MGDYGKEIARIWANDIVKDRKFAFIILLLSAIIIFPLIFWGLTVFGSPLYQWASMIICFGIWLHLTIMIGVSLRNRPIILFNNKIIIRDNKAILYYQ
jgi:hypothetical protein